MAPTLRTSCSIAALLVAVSGLVATSPLDDEDWRYPCDHHRGWDPAEPVYLHFAYEDVLDPATPGLLDGIRVTEPDGAQLELVLAPAEGGLVVVCPLGGLAPETTYRWAVGPFHESWNHVRPPVWNGTTFSEFTTGPGWPEETIDSYAECAAHPIPTASMGTCDGDTGGVGD